MPITGDQTLLKQINRMAIVRRVRQQSGLSRADIAKETGLTKSTVSLLAQELIDEGWLVEHAIQITGALGRRPTPLAIDGGRLAMVGAELGVDRIHVVGLSLSGEIVFKTEQDLQGSGPTEVLGQLARLLIDGVAQVRASGRSVFGVGVGLPGAVDEDAGVLKVAPNLGWRNVDVARPLRAAFDAAGLDALPICMQNEADVAALGEYEFGSAPVPDPLVYLSLGIGVGAGIVVNDRLFVGAAGFAGEVGHSILQIAGARCSCGREGCAEAYIGLRAIARQSASPGDPPRDLDALAAGVAQGELLAVRAAQQAGHYLGVLMQNLWTAFDPGRFVLGGPTCELGAPLLDAAKETIDAYALAAGLPAPEVRVSRYGRRAVAAGAAAMVLHKLLRPV
ncbi:ROK family transcriptional regulator [Niveibacterium umoris]|uniref:Putative NBD/HSP70 family sugar kinase/DNA-binding XRE family transcriptional regulator n=1 Tax=Niveibacterium umoris TaxID=1193620 RepID=A0A840BRZ9_9RHOO|nr:ROK family transcriptional regulator [Niveibacterium umoris]MBB4014442.1 putative NBD/HSP70 family sugar kinase/DNA-binding XRE family transcriptional regulator [Niveibacterium umoris]